MDVKNKVLGGIKGMLEDRMSKRLMPKKPAMEIDITKVSGGKPPEGSPAEEAGESAGMEAREDAGGDLAEKVAKEGGDISMLSPDEKNQLKMLYEKMGC